MLALRKVQVTLCLLLALSAYGLPSLASPKVQAALCGSGDSRIADGSDSDEGFGIGGGNSRKFAFLTLIGPPGPRFPAAFTYDLLVDQFRGLDLTFRPFGINLGESSVIFCFLDPATGAIFKEEVRIFSVPNDRTENREFFVAKFRRNHFSNQLIKDGKAACIGTLVQAKTDSRLYQQLAVGKEIFYGSKDVVPKLINTELSTDCFPYNNCPAPPAGALQQLKLIEKVQKLKERSRNRRPD